MLVDDDLVPYTRTEYHKQEKAFQDTFKDSELDSSEEVPKNPKRMRSGGIPVDTIHEQMALVSALSGLYGVYQTKLRALNKAAKANLKARSKPMHERQKDFEEVIRKNKNEEASE